MFNSYDDLIRYVRTQVRFKGYGNYYELHHVVPINAGGKDEETNLILLKILEHAEAHYLYAMEHKDDLHLYHANLNSAWMVLFGRTKPPEEKEKLLRSFLENPDMDYINDRLNEKLRIMESYVKGKPYKKTVRSSTTWVHKDGVNKNISNGELGKYFMDGWKRGKAPVKKPSTKKKS